MCQSPNSLHRQFPFTKTNYPYKSRVSELFDVMQDVGAGKYSRTMVTADTGEANQNESKCIWSQALSYPICTL